MHWRTLVCIGLLIGTSGCALRPPNIKADYYDISGAVESFDVIDAESGEMNAQSQFILGEYHLYQGTPEDDVHAMRYFLDAAELGHADAQNRVGEMLLAGRGVEADPEEAANWLKRAAKHGVVDAQTALGALHEHGVGVPTDPQEAEKWYLLAAKRGDREAMLGLGRLYRVKPGEEGAFQAKSREWLQRASNLGSPEATYALAQLYESGVGGEKDLTKAVDTYRLAAEMNYSPAYLALADIYADGAQGVVDEAQAAEYTQRALDMGENAARIRLAIQYELGDRVEQSYEEAYQLYLMAAKDNYAYAEYRLGQYHWVGIGRTPNREEALFWLERAADHGMLAAHADYALLAFTKPHPDMDDVMGHLDIAAHHHDPFAQYLLHVLYRHPLPGMPRDLIEASYWFDRAEENAGNAYAKFRIARLYERGYGVPRDYEEAFRWYLWAAQQGVTEAELKVGEMYYDGFHVLKNHKEAYHWYLRAAAENEPDAMYQLGLIDYNGSKGQVDLQMAFDWFLMAARKGHPNAQFQLGNMYFRGEGQRQSDIEAYAWWSLASDGLLETEYPHLTHLIERMTPHEMKQAVAKAALYRKEFMPKFRVAG